MKVVFVYPDTGKIVVRGCGLYYEMNLGWVLGNLWAIYPNVTFEVKDRKDYEKALKEILKLAFGEDARIIVK